MSNWSGVDLWCRTVVPLALVVDGCSLYTWKLLCGWGRLWLLQRSAENSLMGPLHVALCHGWAWVQVPRPSFGSQVGAPFEETVSDSF
jgi:hypothetical protein